MKSLPGITRPWEIYLVHHTHVDIGYTEPQPIIFRKHADYISQALDACAATDHLPPGERFAWTCEVSWTVKTFLERYPHRAEEFFRRVREGRIEVTGLFLQLTDLFGESLLEHAIDYATGLAREHGFQVITAMNDDVNGWAWGLPRMMAARGIRYFDTAINDVQSLPVRPRPRPFYWASPDGSGVLMWHSDGYLRGSSLRFGQPEAEDRVVEYLRRLEADGYPHHVTEIHITGEPQDNAPPGLWICDAIREWNARWEHPKLRLCTPRTWFEHVEAHWPEPIPELRAAWSDWWANGHVSALYESSLARQAQADLETAEAAAAAGGHLDNKRLEEAREAAMFFCEHTWGAWCSTDDPTSLESRAQWNHKASFAYTAAVEAEALLKDTLRSCVEESGEGPSIMVFNPSDTPRTDIVEVLLTDETLDPNTLEGVATRERLEEGPEIHLIAADTEEAEAVARRPVVADSHRRPAQWVRFVARDVPPRGWRQYRIVSGPIDRTSRTRSTGTMLENAHFLLTLDPRTGGISSLVDLASGRELVARGDVTLNQHIYEVIDSPDSREALCGWGKLHTDTPFRRSTPSARIQPGRSLPFGAALVVEGGGGEVPLIRSEVVLYDDLPRVDLFNTVTKLPLTHAEAIYHAFPLAAAQPTVTLDTPGAAIRPGIDQVPGTATDWHGIQHYFAVSGEEGTVIVASPDVSVVQVNGINTGLWQQAVPPHNGLVMSWVMNNYWFTNFPAAQGGMVPFRYSIAAFAGAFDAGTAARFAGAIRHPLVGLVLPRGGRVRSSRAQG